MLDLLLCCHGQSISAKGQSEQSRRLEIVSRVTAGPARNEDVTAIALKIRIEPKARLKLPVFSKRKPMRGGPKITVGTEITLTNPWATPLLTSRRRAASLKTDV